ncbi:MAG: ATP-binding cassette domain-containing protein, partial [Rubrivivax sp.]|nr:ATP-binding cassette domain-containing protein [Rubrivivax sp.]
PVRAPAVQVGDIVCELRGVSTAPAAGAGRDRLAGVSLVLRGGEIVAIAGVSGNGQAALAGVLCGTHMAAAGEVRYLGAPMPRANAARVRRGVARIPEDRQGTGLVGDLPLWENAVSERLTSAAFSRRVAGLRWVRAAAARAHARHIVQRFDVRGAAAGLLDAPVRALSGGNMQKLILGRALLAPEGDAAPQLIVAHQPTWGLDVGAVASVQAELIAARDAGAAVLLVSDDLDEVVALGDRIAVMHDGHLTEARPNAMWTRESLGLAMAGVRDDPPPAPVAASAPAPAPVHTHAP